LAEAKNVQSMKGQNGADASSKLSIPNDVTQADPNWCLLRARGVILIPNLLVRNLAICITNETKNAGRKSATFVLCLCYRSPLFAFICVPFSLMKLAICLTLFF
jgi:hypothetical protein